MDVQVIDLDHPHCDICSAPLPAINISGPRSIPTPRQYVKIDVPIRWDVVIILAGIVVGFSFTLWGVSRW